MDPETQPLDPEIAVIGLSGRFPRARNVEELWLRLAAAEECVTFFTPEELAAAGVPKELERRPDYVPAIGWLDGHDLFDPGFFGMTPREAQITDPQMRLFLECAWEAFEDAGYVPGEAGGRTGVFASASVSPYFWALLQDRELMRLIGGYRMRLGNDRDFLPTWVSYKLGLEGPSLNVQTACSSSLVAVHLACQSLIAQECDLALAGGVSVRQLRRSGYLYQEGAVSSRDGHCRAFDAAATGTVAGDGIGVLLLKRLGEALDERDRIRAVIKGSAINNDGAAKIGYTAPGQRGQARVIREALAMAGVNPEEIGYVEAHGTGTPLGDPIEVAALIEAFGSRRRGFCALGSVKTNLGHLDSAAGVTGLIKATLALERETIPASLHFRQPNPEIPFEDSPFRVCAETTPWPRGAAPRHAGVSSFGIGGTNAHVVLQEPPVQPSAHDDGSRSLLLVSARSQAALDEMSLRLAEHLRDHPELGLADLAYTTQVGRRGFAFRRTVSGRSHEEVATVLASLDPRGITTAEADPESPPPVAFLFPGQGSQHAGMGRDLYRRWRVFRETLDHCADLLAPQVGWDLRRLIQPAPGEEEAAGLDLLRTAVAQPALFALEYALARLWMSLGCRPESMIGHSLGELVAACLAGVFPLEDALRLVVERGRLMQSMAPGAMLAVELSEADVTEALSAAGVGGVLALAAVNAPDCTVVSGPEPAIQTFALHLGASGMACRRLHTSHAFHSPMMAPATAVFAEVVSRCRLRTPEIPFVSSLTGRWINPGEATDPAYWARQLVEPVRLAPGITELLRREQRVLLEVGPGQALTALARRHQDGAGRSVPSLERPTSLEEGEQVFLEALGGLWRAGVRIDWKALHAGTPRRRVALPTYPFERRSFRPGHEAGAGTLAAPLVRSQSVDDWLYEASWKSIPAAPSPTALAGQRGRWLVFADEAGWGDLLLERLRALGEQAVPVRPGESFAQTDEGFVLDPDRPEDYRKLVSAVVTGGPVDGAVHLWSLSPVTAAPLTAAGLAEAQRRGFYSVAFFAQAWLATSAGVPLRLAVVGNGMERVLGDEPVAPEKATLLALVRVLSQEATGISSQCLDFAPRDLSGSAERERGVEQILAELAGPLPDAVVALRGARRWVKTFIPLAVPAREPLLRPGGVWLITGGLGRVGLALAERLARACLARLVLTRLSQVPPRERWASLAAGAGTERDRRLATSLLAIEAAGGEVEAIRADVTNPEEMLRVLAVAEARFGGLDGVIHAAGTVGGAAFRPIEELDRDSTERQLGPKARGLLVLDELLGDRPLDARLLTSSLSSVLGGLGFASYAAANCYLDAYAARSQDGKSPWLSVSWDGWLFQDPETEAQETGLTAEEGGQVLERLLALGRAAHVSVSTVDLERRREIWARRSGQATPASPLRTAPSGDYRNELEQTVAAIWGELLGRESIGRDDNFFDLGGDSLLATQMVSRLRGVVQVSVSLRAAFEAPTVAGLAARIESAREAEDESVAGMPPLERRSPDEPVPLSYSQQRLWFLDQIERDARPYNTLSAIRLMGDLDVPALAASFAAIVRRHEILRTVFPVRDGIPEQKVLPPAPFPLPLVDLSDLPPTRRLPQARDLAREEARRPYQLDCGPLYRNTLLRLAGDEHVVLIAAHHIVLDGWSAGIYRRELAQHYAAFRAGRSPDLPELPFQYGDYAIWQRRWLQGEVLERQLHFWRRILSGLPVIDLPLDHARPARPSFRGGAETLQLGRELSAALQDLARRCDATLFMTLLAAFKILLCRITGQEDVVVGSNIANRRHAALEGLIGFFVNNLVLRTDLSGDPSALEVIARVRKVTLAAYAHQEVPFERLVEELQPDREAGKNPLFQVLFVLQIAAREPLVFPGLELSSLRLDSKAAAFDLLFNLQEKPDGLFGSLQYSQDLFEPETIRNLLERFQTLLKAMTAAPETSLSSIPLSDAQAEASLVSEFIDSLEDDF